ncbi:MAG: hypothetical protein MUC42_11155, partial [Bryobacter sp.]|nr:hypothetical protein [Bryobacter sp.]
MSLSLAAAAAPPWTIHSNQSVPQVRFATAEIHAAMASKGIQVIEAPLDPAAGAQQGPRILVSAARTESEKLAAAMGWKLPADLPAQAYSIRKAASGAIGVLAADPNGAMYGGLDIAEAVRHGTLDALTNSDHRPHVEQRGIKFNIPLDLRTPSYSDNSHDAQANIPEMWSFDFWREFIDSMARHRYNVLSLWSLHPFPSIVKVPEFPDVALDDVWRTRVPFDDTYTHSGSDMFRPELLRDVEVVRKMTIGDKIRFWRDVMQYAHDRGIGVYWFTWN